MFFFTLWVFVHLFPFLWEGGAGFDRGRAVKYLKGEMG